MNHPKDLRASERIPLRQRIKVQAKGRMASYAIALNVSMGGLLLSAAPTLPVGSSCTLDIPISAQDTTRHLLAEGTVVRSDAHGTAIRFSENLDLQAYHALAEQGSPSLGRSMVNAYINYFKVSQSDDPAACEEMLGVSRQTYNRVFLSTFCTCLPLAVLPVWLFQSSLPPLPTWAKVATSFGYGAVWMGVIQPSVDLLIFKIIRDRGTNA